MKLLQVRGLRAAYGRVEVLHGLDFAVEEGSITVVLGANGAGKTTMLRAICGMVSRRGEIRLDGSRIDRLPTDRISRLGIGHVPQGRGTFVDLSVNDNLRVGAYARRDGDGIARDIERAYKWFPALADRQRQMAGSLSGGEQQMLAVSRALMSRPRLLLLDEPSLGLAPLVVRNLIDVLAQIHKETKTTMLLVEQNVSAALAVASRAFVLESGRIALEGPPDSLRENPNLRKAYLGY